MKTASKSIREKIAVGDRVLIPWGGAPKVAVVIEDRGYIGFQGRRVLRVSHGTEAGDSLESFEIPEAEVKLFRRARSAARRMTRSVVSTKNGKHKR